MVHYASRTRRKTKNYNKIKKKEKRERERGEEVEDERRWVDLQREANKGKGEELRSSGREREGKRI